MAPLNLIAKTAAWLRFSLACGLRSPSQYMNHIPGLHASSFISPECQLREKLQTTDHLLPRFHVFHVFLFGRTKTFCARCLPALMVHLHSSSLPIQFRCWTPVDCITLQSFAHWMDSAEGNLQKNTSRRLC